MIITKVKVGQKYKVSQKLDNICPSINSIIVINEIREEEQGSDKRDKIIYSMISGNRRASSLYFWADCKFERALKLIEDVEEIPLIFN